MPCLPAAWPACHDSGVKAKSLQATGGWRWGGGTCVGGRSPAGGAAGPFFDSLPRLQGASGGNQQLGPGLTPWGWFCKQVACSVSALAWSPEPGLQKFKAL